VREKPVGAAGCAHPRRDNPAHPGRYQLLAVRFPEIKIGMASITPTKESIRRIKCSSVDARLQRLDYILSYLVTTRAYGRPDHSRYIFRGAAQFPHHSVHRCASHVLDGAPPAGVCQADSPAHRIME
jgi:hypothetical protein